MDTLPPIIQQALAFEKSNWANGSVHEDVFYKLQPDSPTGPPGTPLKIEEETDTAQYLLPPATAMSRFIYQSENLSRLVRAGFCRCSLALFPKEPRRWLSGCRLGTWNKGNFP